MWQIFYPRWGLFHFSFHYIWGQFALCYYWVFTLKLTVWRISRIARLLWDRIKPFSLINWKSSATGARFDKLSERLNAVQSTVDFKWRYCDTRSFLFDRLGISQMGTVIACVQLKFILLFFICKTVERKRHANLMIINTYTLS